MQKNIAFYISDHNMEHAFRNVPILQNMLKMEEEVQIFVKSGKMQVEWMKSYLKPDERLHFLAMEMKDRETDLWDTLAQGEEEFLREEKIGLVISDICPWIFLSADNLRIKSLLLANYTWADLAKEEEEKEEYLSCYELASRFFIYDLHVPELTGYGVEYEMVSLLNRPYNMEVIESLEEKIGGPFVFVDLPKWQEEKKDEAAHGDERNHEEKIGRTGRDLSYLPYRFVITEGTPLKGENVIVLSKETKNPQDYVAASRCLIGWGSWNTISQALLSNKKAAFFVQAEIPMSSRMIGTLVERNQCILAEEKEIFKMEELLKKLEVFSYSYEQEYYNSDYDLAKKILFAYPEKRRRNRS